MSGIDLQNPKVLKNYLTNQAKEGKGKFFVKKEVVCFKNYDGLEFIVPEEVPKELVDQYLGKTVKVESAKTDVEEPKTEKELELDKLTDEQLKELAKEVGVKGYATTKRENLIKKLL